MSGGQQTNTAHDWTTTTAPHTFGGWNHLKGVVARDLPTKVNRARRIIAATRSLIH